jgi:hypothetical protein
VLRASMKMAAAALAAGAVLTACGPVKMGAAAVMSSSPRISSSTLAAQVSDLNQGYQRYKGKVALQYPVSQMPQQVLGWLVKFRVRDELAADRGIQVSPAQVQRAMAQIRAQARTSSGTTVNLAQLAVANGLPPDELTALARYQAIETALISQLDGGTLPKSNTALQALGSQFNKAECQAAKKLDISINPQYGRLDYAQYSIIAAPTTLSAAAGSPTPAVSPAASPSASPQLKPAC